jgi:hypothetical protein
MYGVPEDLPIERFVGDALFQVRLGLDGVHFAFGQAGTISVYGHWELLDSNGVMIDQYRGAEDRQGYHLHVIFNADVVASKVQPPEWFSLTFSTGHELKIYDEPQFESFSLQPDDIHV